MWYVLCKLDYCFAESYVLDLNIQILFRIVIQYLLFLLIRKNICSHHRQFILSEKDYSPGMYPLHTCLSFLLRISAIKNVKVLQRDLRFGSHSTGWLSNQVLATVNTTRIWFIETYQLIAAGKRSWQEDYQSPQSTLIVELILETSSGKSIKLQTNSA